MYKLAIIKSARTDLLGCRPVIGTGRTGNCIELRPVRIYLQPTPEAGPARRINPVI